MDNIYQLLLVALGSSGLMSFIQFLISRNDKKAKQLNCMSEDIKSVKEIMATKDEIQNIKNEMNDINRQLDRVQLNLLIKLFPDKTDAIMKVAEKYFVSEGGNWYLSNLFIDYCREKSLELPNWFVHKD